MIKQRLLIIPWLVLALVACQRAPQSSATPVSPTQARPQVTSEATSASPAEGIQSPTPGQAETSSSALANCTVVSQESDPTPDPDSPFLPIGADEWVEGPEGAQITIIEYADFQ